jgi:hypothetical protein
VTIRTLPASVRSHCVGGGLCTAAEFQSIRTALDVAYTMDDVANFLRPNGFNVVAWPAATGPYGAVERNGRRLLTFNLAENSPNTAVVVVDP